MSRDKDFDARQDEFLKQREQVRPVTRNLIDAVMFDTWPSHTAIVDFGIDSQQHYEALYYPLREAEIMPKALDAALGDGEKLTMLARQSASNPHKDIEFSTSWDVVLGRDWPSNAPTQHRERAPSDHEERQPSTEHEQEPKPRAASPRTIAREKSVDQLEQHSRNLGKERD